MKSRAWLFRAAVFTGVACSYMIYQNCAPSGSSAFNLGASSTSGPAISGLALNQQSYSQNQVMSGAAAVIATGSNLICSWMITGSGQAATNVNTPLTNTTCALPNGQAAPATAGIYTLTLTVTDANGLMTTSTVDFTVTSTNPSPTAVPSPSAGAGSSPSPTPAPIMYSCPNIPSNNCVANSPCETTCDGNYSNNATCTYYNQNATPTTVGCTRITSVTTIYACPFVHSSGCDSSDVCNSTCEGEYQAGSTCTYHLQNAVPESVSCTSEKGVASQALYQCPFIHSFQCDSASACESYCIGQVSKSGTCTYYEMNAVPVTANCMFIGNFTF